MKRAFCFLGLAALAAACAPVAPLDSGLPNVVATTALVGDVAAAVGGDLIDLHVLLPKSADPHSFEPSARDAALVADADLVLTNGLGLEEFLQGLLENAGGDSQVLAVSDGIATIDFQAGVNGGTHGDDGQAGSPDPHVWMNPLNVRTWAQNIADAYSALDPNHVDDYQANAEAYIASLEALDAWAQKQISQLPPGRRVLVTDHDSFGYFADHYGFKVVGAMIPSYSTLGEPSAAEIAALEGAIAQFDIPAIFVGVSMNPALGEQVASDTGVQLVPVYTGSLSDTPGGPTTYIEMLRYDVEAIVAALK